MEFDVPDVDGVRAFYVEYDLEGETIGRISDPENDRAWIESDVTTTVED